MIQINWSWKLYAKLLPLGLFVWFMPKLIYLFYGGTEFALEGSFGLGILAGALWIRVLRGAVK